MNNNKKLHFIFRRPKPKDGRKMWNIARDSKTLDLNSLYHYLIMSSHFSKTSLIAEYDKKVVGFVTGYTPPGMHDTLFIWQVAVADGYQGKGLGLKLLLNAFDSENSSYRRLLATVTPSNTASINLFTAASRELKAPCKFEDVVFGKEEFGETGHEPEILFNIGPVTSLSKKYNLMNVRQKDS